MRKIISALAALSLTFTMTGCSFAEDSATKTSQGILINGENINLPVYSIDDSNYFKIRDVAYYMNFGVDYDYNSNSIVIDSGLPYSGDIPSNDQLSSATAEESLQSITINGKAYSDITAYNIGGSNYFKIRDLAQNIDFGCKYNKNSNSIELCSDFGYNTADVWGRCKDSNDLKFTAIDVGQGDSILIEFPNNEGEMLIDAGTSDSEEHILDYLLDELPDDKLEYVIATHPHADHIGSMKAVIDNIAIDNFYNSKVAHTTKTYTNMVKSLKDKGLGTDFSVNETIQISPDLSFTFLAPLNDYSNDLNNSSTVIKLTYKGNSFLLLGDAEQQSEADMLSSSEDLSADVVKVGHHGSKTSSTQAFINATGAKYAVASMGIDNSYGHPAIDTVLRWQNSGAKFLATAQLGDIVITSDGENIKAYPDTDYVQ